MPCNETLIALAIPSELKLLDRFNLCAKKKMEATFVTSIFKLLLDVYKLMVKNHQVIEPSIIPAWTASSSA